MHGPSLAQQNVVFLHSEMPDNLVSNLLYFLSKYNMLCFLFIFLLPIFTKNTIIIIIILFYFTFLFIEYFFIGLFQFFTFQDVSWIFWKYVLFCIGNSMICSDIWHKYHGWYFKIVIGNFTRLWASEIWDNFEIIIMSDIYATYRVQIMLLLVYTTTRKRFVIFTNSAEIPLL